MNDFLYLNAAFSRLKCEESAPETRRRKAALSNPMMIRMDRFMRTEIEAIAKANGVSVSDVIRHAVRLELPVIQSGIATLLPQ